MSKGKAIGSIARRRKITLSMSISLAISSAHQACRWSRPALCTNTQHLGRPANFGRRPLIVLGCWPEKQA